MAAEQGEQGDEQAGLVALPADVLAHVAAHVAAADVARLACVSHATAAAVAACDGLWAACAQARSWWSRPAGAIGQASGTWQSRYMAAHEATHKFAAPGEEVVLQPDWQQQGASSAPVAVPSPTLISRHSSLRGYQVAWARGVRLAWLSVDDDDGGGTAAGGPCSVQSISHRHEHAHSGAVNALASLAAGPRGYITCSGGEDGLVKLWAPPGTAASQRMRTNEAAPELLVRPLRTLRGHTAGVTALALLAAGSEHGGCCSAAQGAILASGSADRTVRLWALSPLVPLPSGFKSPGSSSQAQLACLRGHTRAITALVPLPQAPDQLDPPATPPPLLASASLSGFIKVHDAASSVCTSNYVLSSRVVAAAALSGLGSHALLACGGDVLTAIVDVRQAGAALSVRTGGRSAAGSQVLALATHGHLAVTGHASRVCLWDLRAASSNSSSNAADPAGSGAGGSLRPLHVWSAGKRSACGRGPFNFVHVDRLKVVAATCGKGYEPALLTWDVRTGDRLSMLYAGEADGSVFAGRSAAAEESTSSGSSDSGSGGGSSDSDRPAGPERSTRHVGRGSHRESEAVGEGLPPGGSSSAYSGPHGSAEAAAATAAAVSARQLSSGAGGARRQQLLLQRAAAFFSPDGACGLAVSGALLAGQEAGSGALLVKDFRRGIDGLGTAGSDALGEVSDEEWTREWEGEGEGGMTSPRGKFWRAA